MKVLIPTCDLVLILFSQCVNNETFGQEETNSVNIDN